MDGSNLIAVTLFVAVAVVSCVVVWQVFLTFRARGQRGADERQREQTEEMVESLRRIEKALADQADRITSIETKLREVD